MHKAITVLSELRDQLPRDHHERPGIVRAIEVLKVEQARPARWKPLSFKRGLPGSGQWFATDTNGTGLSFCLTRVDYSDGEPGYVIEVSKGQELRHQETGIRRFDMAKAWCDGHLHQTAMGDR